MVACCGQSGSASDSRFAAGVEPRQHVIGGRFQARAKTLLGELFGRSQRTARGIEAARPYESTLPEAEKTLRRLRERQMEAQAADEALLELDAASGPLAAAEKLAEQGFGPRLKPTADDVLARLNANRKPSA